VLRGRLTDEDDGATLALRLAERGLLDLDAAIAKIVPELGESNWAATATLDDILASTSGIPLRMATEFDAAFDGDDALQRMAADGPSPVEADRRIA
jgi:CubicO group peptidase (beta-lactamase class C family)